MTPERRKTPRMNVEGIGFVSFSLKGKYDLLGTLEEVGRDGIRVDLFPTGPTAEPVKGDIVSMTEIPKGLRSLVQGRSGHIVWTKGSRCGINFDRPLDIECTDLEVRLQNNQLLPWCR